MQHMSSVSAEGHVELSGKGCVPVLLATGVFLDEFWPLGTVD